MSSIIVSDIKRVIVGLGLTGMSCLRYLADSSGPLVVMDTRDNPPLLEQAKAAYPDVVFIMGALDESLLLHADEVIVSPGISLQQPVFEKLKEADIKIIGDLDIFCHQAKAPVVLITGSNAKSTVTTLVGEMAKACDKKVAVGGNLGTPALDLLDDSVELYIIEASSFQLERSDALNADVAVILNITPDHMDRYRNIQDYHQAKHRIFRGCKLAVFNRDDALTRPLLAKQVKQINFGLTQPDLDQFGCITVAGESWLALGSERLIREHDLKLVGKHHSENALAALAIGRALGLEQDKMLDVLKVFSGLPHRCQEILKHNHVSWINDSKATNVGAAIAAINGLSHEKNIIWLAGGDGKGADFSSLLPVVKKKVKHSILMGKSAQAIAEVLVGLPVTIVNSMQEAIKQANKLAKENDLVLLSPACASFDWYKNYEHRGNDFTSEVSKQIAEVAL